MSQIKTLLAEEGNALNHFNSQARVLEQKASTLLDGAKTLRRIIDSVDKNQSIPWETIIQLIEVYKMTEHLEHGWVKEIFTPDELKQYAEFEKEMKANATPEQKAAMENNWSQLVDEVKNNLKQDPDSKIGIYLGKRLWIGLMGSTVKICPFKNQKFEQGFGEGKGLDEVGLTPQIVSWMDKAMDAYWRDRIYGILDQVGKAPSASVLDLWNEMLVDMYGEESSRKNVIYEIALNDDQVSPEAKAWLRNILDS